MLPKLMRQNQAYNALPILLEDTAQKFLNKNAVVFKDKNLSYKQLNDYANQFANYLLANGIETGDIIGMAVERSFEMLICILGMLKAGAVYTPIDPKYPQERIEYMLSHSNAKKLLVFAADSGKFHSNATEIIIENIWSELNNYTTEFSQVEIEGTDLAYILYTSGSTGRPKGVEIMHSNLSNLLKSIQIEPGITQHDRLLAITTISFDIAALELFLPLIAGAELIIADFETARDGRLLLDMIEEKKITIMQGTPSTWRMMLDSGWKKKYPLKIFCGGEPLKLELAKKLLARCGELWNMYGPTETTIYSIIKKIANEDKTITIGKPINNTQIYLLNEQNEIADYGSLGEILIGGDGVAAGYLNQPDLTQERFINDSFNDIPGTKLYKTGDLGRYEENGNIEYHGRIDHQVKIRGHRIELGEIENVLAEEDDIGQAVVVPQEDSSGEINLIAYIVQAKHTLVPETAIIDTPKTVKDTWRINLQKKLPDYMIPLDFIALDKFPLTPNYKIDKIQLPKPQRNISIDAKDIPYDEHTKIVAAIWEEIFGIDTISIKHDFFELGGNSLLAVKIMAAIQRKTGRRLPLSTLFENTTVAGLAKKLSSDKEEKWQALVPIKTTGSKLPLYIIHGAGLNLIFFKSTTEYLDEEQPVYGLQAVGLNKKTKPVSSFEEIAKIYISEMLESNPEGPYNLVGYSMGGIIAFEMARQLIAMNKIINFIGVLDTYVHTREDKDGKLNKIKRQMNKLPFLAGSFIKYPKETIAYQLSWLTKKVFKKKHNKDVVDTDFLTKDEIAIYEAYENAQKEYVLKPSDIKVTVFRVEKRLYFLHDRITLGWKKFAKKGVSVIVVPGDHRTFLYKPNDKMFASILQKAIDHSTIDSSH